MYLSVKGIKMILVIVLVIIYVAAWLYTRDNE